MIELTPSCVCLHAALPQDPDWNRPTGTADQDEAGETGGSVPSLVVTEIEEVSPETAHLYS